MSTTGNALFQCDEAAGFDGEMVARVGLNVNGNQLKWRCYGELLSTSTEDACMANDGSMTNVGCTDPDHSNNAICARNAMMLAIITDLTATGCLETTTTSTTTSTTTTSTTTSTTTTSTTTSTTTTSTTTSTTTTSTTAGTTSETTTTLPCADYLDNEDPHYVYWKGAKLSKIERIGDDGATILVNVPDQFQSTWDYNDEATAWDTYIGILMFSRTECGPDFVEALGDGRLSWDIQDESADLYSDYYSYVRLGQPAERRAATLQFLYTPSGADDLMNTKKDQLYIHLNGLSSVDMDWKEITLASCVDKITIGIMIPSEEVAGDYDHARCVGIQKEIGY